MPCPESGTRALSPSRRASPSHFHTLCDSRKWTEQRKRGGNGCLGASAAAVTAQQWQPGLFSVSESGNRPCRAHGCKAAAEHGAAAAKLWIPQRSTWLQSFWWDWPGWPLSSLSRSRGPACGASDVTHGRECEATPKRCTLTVGVCDGSPLRLAPSGLDIWFFFFCEHTNSRRPGVTCTTPSHARRRL